MILQSHFGAYIWINHNSKSVHCSTIYHSQDVEENLISYYLFRAKLFNPLNSSPSPCTAKIGLALLCPAWLIGLLMMDSSGFSYSARQEKLWYHGFSFAYSLSDLSTGLLPPLRERNPRSGGREALLSFAADDGGVILNEAADSGRGQQRMVSVHGERGWRDEVWAVGGWEKAMAVWTRVWSSAWCLLCSVYPALCPWRCTWTSKLWLVLLPLPFKDIVTCCFCGQTSIS